MKMSSKFTCRFCKEQFDLPKGLYKHLQTAHSAGSSRDNRICPICGVLCSKYEGYRDHLLYIHGQSNEGQQLSFKTLNEFLLWKTEIEIKYHCKYVLQSAPKVLSTKEKKYFYQCDGSGSKPKDKKSVIMKSCSSVISVVEGSGIFKVEYWDAHSNHAKSAELSVQNELEAAISSVEMVNAIADSDDSLDRSEEYTIDTNSNPFSSMKKQSFVKSSSVNKLNSSQIASAALKTKSFQSLKPDVAKKKTTNTSMLFSLASVACGKGITKKSSSKLSEKKNENQSKTSEIKNENKDSISSFPKEINDSIPLSSTSVTTSPKSAISAASATSKSSAGMSKVTTSSTTKVTPSGPQAIAPKPASMTNSNISSLFTANSVYPNQLVIVNPVGMDQNSSQNVMTAGQNIVLSLPMGQNILSANTTTSQSGNQTAENKAKSIESDDVLKDESSKVKTSSLTTKSSAKALMGVSKNCTVTKTTTLKMENSKTLSNSVTVSNISTTTSASAITLPSGINNTPVLLSSLPVGSTFMSVNNNLIPIATPSGTFLPSSLPPNIVLTPVPSTTMSSIQSGSKTSVSSSIGSTSSGLVLPTSLPPNLVLTPVISSTATNSQSSPKFTLSSCIGSSPGTFLPTSLPPNIVLTPILASTQTATKTTNSRIGSSVAKTLQNQLLFSVPSTPVTVSSIVKEPVFSSASIKQTNCIISSSATSLVSSAKAPTTSTPQKSKPNVSLNSVSSPISARKSMQTSTTKIPPVKTSLASLPLFNKLGSDVVLQKINNTTSIAKSSVTSTSPPTKKARKSISKSLKSTIGSNPTVLSSSTKTVSAVPGGISTNVVNSQLNLAPISSTPDVTMMPQTMNSGTLIFESSGEIFMLEPIENNAVKNLTPSRSNLEMSKLKMDSSVQTLDDFEEDIFTSNSNRKRAACSSEDDTVMMKVKCYQLEMQYLNSQAACKRLKVELTKERLKNAELTGESVTSNECETSGESRNKAREIMKEIEDKFKENKDGDVYTMTKTSVLRSLYEDIEVLCLENSDLRKELDNYRTHDKFYKNLKKMIFDEEF